jgi:hypothetical protein
VKADWDKKAMRKKEEEEVKFTRALLSKGAVLHEILT